MIDSAMGEKPAEGDRTGLLVAHALRHEAGAIVARLTRSLGVRHLQLAEDAVQEALLRALRVWPYRGIPKNIRGWLLATARNVAIDALRRESSFLRKLTEYSKADVPHAGESAEGASGPDDFGDDQLAMMFMCCHSKLSFDAQIALTLKVVSGFGVSEIANAMMAAPETIAQRIVRAKRTLRSVAEQFTLPCPSEAGVRLNAVLRVLYLIFNEGYKQSGSARSSATTRRWPAPKATRFLR
jgi:RNA polymerase sigma-70 factor, ECF subfamily